MAWTHYTAALNGTRPITKAERDELFDQLNAKLVGSCFYGFSLNATTQAEVSASDLITDLARLDDSLAPSTTLDRLDNLLYACASAFTNAAAARSAALIAEGITIGNLAAYYASGLDSYRLWNFYWRMIEALVPITSSPLAPYFVKRTASSSRTKCGFPEFSGYVSTPPKIYLKRNHSGTVSTAAANTAPPGGPSNFRDTSETFSGSESIPDRSSCTVVDTVSSSWSVTDIGGTTTGSLSDKLDDSTIGGERGCEPFDYDFNPCSPTNTATTRTYSHSFSITGFTSTGSFVITNDDEFTTALLESDVDSFMPAFSGSYTSGASTALHDLTSDELTMTKRALQYKFTLPTLTGFSAYQIDWIERFTPVVGSVVDTPKTYNWDGVATETGAYTVNAPATPGEVTIVSVVGTVTC